ncbi:hypothetical protein WN944_009180 [Citrus x changshan-huyou]|uniref:Uncharacterized protein n=1 Tax=Citrus x changshan-huyou TaxID=2935761 RepID=A0AAP0MPE0_9ROSI
MNGGMETEVYPVQQLGAMNNMNNIHRIRVGPKWMGKMDLEQPKPIQR